MDIYLEAFLPLFVAINLPGILPLFIGLTEGLAEAVRNQLAFRAVATAFIIALLILFAGQVVFQTLGITISDLRVGGGLVLLVLSITDLLFSDYRQRTPPDDDDEDGGEDGSQAAGTLGIVPLGIPLTMGPAAITTILVSQQSYGYLPALAALVTNLALVALAFRFGPALLQMLGANAVKAVGKVASLFLAAIAVAMIRAGVVGMIAAG